MTTLEAFRKRYQSLGEAGARCDKCLYRHLTKVVVGAAKGIGCEHDQLQCRRRAPHNWHPVNPDDWCGEFKKGEWII